jgi:hypothetical protein
MNTNQPTSNTQTTTTATTTTTDPYSPLRISTVTLLILSLIIFILSNRQSWSSSSPSSLLLLTTSSSPNNNLDLEDYPIFIPSLGKRSKDITQKNQQPHTKYFPSICAAAMQQYSEQFKTTCQIPCSTPSDATTKKLNLPPLSIPHYTTSHQDIGEYVNEILKQAWGTNPPWIDLYVRVGLCSSRHASTDYSGVERLWYLIRSIEIFWPRFLGRVILHVNDGDESMISLLELGTTTHQWEIIYGLEPCLPGRIHNQWSYLRIGDLTEADWVVTTDSDTLLFLPATPELLFSRGGKLRMLTSNQFQQQYWDNTQSWFTKLPSVGIGHGMLCQPISVWNPSLRKMLQWIAQDQWKVPCYEMVLGEFATAANSTTTTTTTNDHSIETFCWMCQLVMYLATHYEQDMNVYVDLFPMEKRQDCFQRWIAHYSYYNDEKSYDGVDHTLHGSASKLIREGLCRMLLHHGIIDKQECTRDKILSPMKNLMMSLEKNFTVIELLEYRFFTFYPMKKRFDQGCFSSCTTSATNNNKNNKECDVRFFQHMKLRWDKLIVKNQVKNNNFDT